MLELVFLIVALILFVLAALAISSPHQGRLIPLGLAFVVAAMISTLLP